MEEIVSENKMEVERSITLIDLWIIIKKYWVQLVTISLVVAIVVGIFSYIFVKRTYTATTSLMINASDVYDSTGSASQANTTKNYGLSLYPSISDMLRRTHVVTNNMKSVTKDELRAFYTDWDKTITDEKFNAEYYEIDFDVKPLDITCSQTAADSLMFTISYTSTESAIVAKSTINAIAFSLIEVSDTKKVGEDGYSYPFGGMLSPVELATNATGAHPWRMYPIIAFFGMFVLLYVYFLLLNFFDESVRSKTEIEDITGFNVIAYIEDLTEKKSKKRK